MNQPRNSSLGPVNFDHWPYPKTCAHRGAGKLAPENTLAAFRLGASLGYTMFEFDVKLSRDGFAMLMHDDGMERTTDGQGPFARKDFSELVQLDAGAWHSPRFAGEVIPTLQGVSRWLAANGCVANIEIKPCPGREVETGARVAQEARRLFVDHAFAPLLSSFDEVALWQAKQVAPELPRALLVEALPSDWIARCRRLGCVAIHPHFSQLSEAMIGQAHAEGLRVGSYTVNEPELAVRFLSWGLDVLITDNLDGIAP
jgi:glycerophosphoryl diester phosphodiesterase